MGACTVQEVTGTVQNQEKEAEKWSCLIGRDKMERQERGLLGGRFAPRPDLRLNSVQYLLMSLKKRQAWLYL